MGLRDMRSNSKYGITGGVKLAQKRKPKPRLGKVVSLESNQERGNWAERNQKTPKARNCNRSGKEGQERAISLYPVQARGT